jgi:hypothetical protein
LLYNSFKNTTDDEYPMLSTVSAVFAKSSVVWSTLFYVLTNKSIKSKLLMCNKNNNQSTLTTQYYSKRETFDQKQSKIILYKRINRRPTRNEIFI